MLRDSIAKFFKVDTLISNLTGYVETRIELVKIEAKEELAKGLATVLVYLFLAFVFALVVVFVSIGIALKISDAWGALAGFSVVAGFYLIVGFILFLRRESLSRGVEARLGVLLNKKKK